MAGILLSGQLIPDVDLIDKRRDWTLFGAVTRAPRSSGQKRVGEGEPLASLLL